MKEKEWETNCFTKDFARMIQLFRIITEHLDFSQPFKMEIEYNPEQLRTSVKSYMPKEVLESCNQKVEEEHGEKNQQAVKA